ncbi:MAG: hypothetical protein J6D02_12315 [Lachnospira sp.]|nr:hypothetical protein [Lachnospira sp.]
MGKVKKFILITFLTIIAITFLISAYYLATYKIPAPVDTRAIVKEKALKYLNERYGEEFEITSCGEYINSDNYIAYAYVKGMPQNDDYKVTLRGWITKGKNKITFRDNYVAIKLKPELKEYIAYALKEVCPECLIDVTFPNNCLENNVDEYKTLEEFLLKDTYWKPFIDVQIIVYKENKNKLTNYSNIILSNLVDKKIGGSATLYFITNQNKYNEIVHNPEMDIGICGEDYVYTHCILKENKTFDIRICDD